MAFLEPGSTGFNGETWRHLTEGPPIAQVEADSIVGGRDQYDNTENRRARRPSRSAFGIRLPSTTTLSGYHLQLSRWLHPKIDRPAKPEPRRDPPRYLYPVKPCATGAHGFRVGAGPAGALRKWIRIRRERGVVVSRAEENLAEQDMFFRFAGLSHQVDQRTDPFLGQRGDDGSCLSQSSAALARVTNSCSATCFLPRLFK